MEQGDDWHDAHSHDGPAGQGPRQPPPPVAAAVLTSGSSDGGGISPSAFLTYVSIGFGCTIGLIAVGVTLWLLTRRVLRQRQGRQTATTTAAAAQDPRRAQADAVHRMIEDKRRAAAAARKPFLVVHPGGDAMVAFKESSKAAGPAPDPHEELIKSYIGGNGSSGTISLTAVAAGGGAAGLPAGAGCPCEQQQAQQQEQARLMSRRALVAAAALSGRTSSGLADMLAAYSPTAQAAAASAGAASFDAEDGRHQHQQHTHPLQAASSSSGHQGPSPAPSLSRQSSLGGPPSAYSRSSSGASSAGEGLALLHGRSSGLDPRAQGSDENV
ncbi:hypothetical protein ABPG75_012420 [Micractinium tetrahymenae]